MIYLRKGTIYIEYLCLIYSSCETQLATFDRDVLNLLPEI